MVKNAKEKTLRKIVIYLPYKLILFAFSCAETIFTLREEKKNIQKAH